MVFVHITAFIRKIVTSKDICRRFNRATFSQYLLFWIYIWKILRTHSFKPNYQWYFSIVYTFPNLPRLIKIILIIKSLLMDFESKRVKWGTDLEECANDGEGGVDKHSCLGNHWGVQLTESKPDMFNVLKKNLQ